MYGGPRQSATSMAHLMDAHLMAHKRKDGDHFADLEQAVNDALRQAFGSAEFLHI